eukprot:Unigene1121_Nuclearia_a/m.3601 Unigene1121_Nuclearia_a/g.3601  ORF Unigene1121_Nuclearia_a/g.3601 Unigene1121_Nuclearia_a/m.3601 type:complete len:212 (+) Unigene1121_Nuclearia_a:529-1164(+)
MIDRDTAGHTTTQYGTNRPFWGEEFFFSELDFKRANACIYLVVHRLNGKDDSKPVGIITIPYTTIRDTAAVKCEWLPLSDLAGTEDPDGELGALLVEVEKQREHVLPSREYATLVSLVTRPDLALPRALAKIAANKLEKVAGLLLRVFFLRNRAYEYVKGLVLSEIRSTENASIIFRGNSLATKTLDLYMKIVGGRYLEVTLRKVLSDVYE